MLWFEKYNIILLSFGRFLRIVRVADSIFGFVRLVWLVIVYF